MDNPTIKSFGEMSADELIPQLQAHVKKAFMPNRSKAGASRTWKMQAAMLADETGEIRATFWNRDQDLRDFEGRDIIIKSGDERGITTIDYEDKKTHTVTRQLSVEKEATMDEVVGSESTATEKQAIKGEPRSVRVYEDESVKRESIERQHALSEAVMLVSHSIPPNEAGNIFNPDVVVNIADKFYRFLSAGRVPPAQAAPEPAPEPDGEVL